MENQKSIVPVGIVVIVIAAFSYFIFNSKSSKDDYPVSLADVAKEYGWDSIADVEWHINNGTFKAVQIDGVLYIMRSELDKRNNNGSTAHLARTRFVK